MLCIPRLRIAILNEEIALWEKRLSDKPGDIPYLGYMRTTLRGRVKEMEDQEKTYQQIKKELEGGILVVPFTGDVNFSESEVVDRLIEIFGDVEIIPGISSIQVAASKAKIPLDKSRVITMHVTTSIEEKKLELQKAVVDGYNIILIPRPWPKDPKKHFMPSEVAFYLKKNGFDTSKIPVHVFESLTNGKEQTFTGSVQELEGKEFSDLSVMVISQTRSESYISF